MVHELFKCVYLNNSSTDHFVGLALKGLILEAKFGDDP